MPFWQPHTANHPILARETYDIQKKELNDSISFIRNKLNLEPKVFCYPNGQLDDYNNDTVAILKKLNIEYSLTGVYGFVGYKENINKTTNSFHLRRIAFPINFDDFYSYVSGFESFKNSFRKD